MVFTQTHMRPYNMKPRRLMYQEFQDELPFKKTKFHSMRNAKQFPNPMGDGNKYWGEDEIELWLKSYDAGLRDEKLVALSKQIQERRESLANELLSAYVSSDKTSLLMEDNDEVSHDEF